MATVCTAAFARLPSQTQHLPFLYACSLWVPSLRPVAFRTAVAAADERPNPSAPVHSTGEGDSSESWTSLLHVVKPLIAVVAATTGVALLAQLFIRYVTDIAAHMPRALYAAHLSFVLHAADSSCGGNI